MILTKIITLFRLLWNFIYSVLLISPIAFCFGGVAGLVALLKNWFDESAIIWDNIYRNKLISIISNKRCKSIEGFFQFEMNEHLRYSDYPKYIQVYARGYEIIMERKQKLVTDDDFKLYPDYEVYNLDSPFVGVNVGYQELVNLNANVKVLKM